MGLQFVGLNVFTWRMTEVTSATSGHHLDTNIIGLASYQHALQSIIELPALYHAQDRNSRERNAFLEAWLINMRLLIEFFGIGGSQIRSNNAKDYKAAHFLEIEISEVVVEELNEFWTMVSQLVVHLSRNRDPSRNDFEINLSLGNLERLAGLILTISKDFQKALEGLGSSYSSLIEIANASAETSRNFRAPITNIEN